MGRDTLTVDVRFGDMIKEVPAFIHRFHTSPNGREYRLYSRITPIAQDGFKFEHDDRGRWFGYKT
jgi:hypothetical protein